MLSLAKVEAARDRVDEVARRTPLEYSHSFSAMVGANVHCKLENFQRTGSFKIRGAMNRIATLTETETENGVVTASAGNHAQGVALAATRAGIDSKIVMPKHPPSAKSRPLRGTVAMSCYSAPTTTTPRAARTNSSRSRAGRTSMPSTTRW